MGAIRARRQSEVAAAVVLAMLFVPHILEQLPVGLEGLRAPTHVAAILLAAYLALCYWLLTGLPVRVHLAVIICFAVFLLSIVPYLFVSLRQIHEAYLGCLLQYTAYPLIVAVFLSSAITGHRLLRLCCIILSVQGGLTALFVAMNLARGRLPMLHPVSLSPVTDADSLILGSLGFITLAALQPPEERWKRRQRAKRIPWIASAVLLSVLGATTFARATIGGFIAGLLVLLVLRARGPRSAVRATRGIIFACALVPLLVCLNIITPGMLGRVGAMIIRKRAVEQIYGSTLMRRAAVWQAFVSRVSWADIVGTRPALHEYDYYHGLGVKRTVETPHNYWISLLLTAGYGGVLAVLVLWDYTVRLVGQSRYVATRWVLPWMVFLSVQGITGRGAFLGMMTLVFWVIVAVVLAEGNGTSWLIGRSGPPAAFRPYAGLWGDRPVPIRR